MLEKIYWSRMPGNVVNLRTGIATEEKKWEGNIREWYETLLDVCIRAAEIGCHGKTFVESELESTEENVTNYLEPLNNLKLIISSDVNCILASTTLFRPGQNWKLDDEPEDMPIGRFGERFEVFVKHSLPRNKILLKKNDLKIAEIEISDMDII